MYAVDTIEAATIVAIIKDVMTRMNLKLHGQCYDGASVMSGMRTGIAKQISDLEPRAIYTHCYGHALNLATGDTLKQSKIMRDALEMTHEIIKLIKFSPRREGIFRNI